MDNLLLLKNSFDEGKYFPFSIERTSRYLIVFVLASLAQHVAQAKEMDP